MSPSSTDLVFITGATGFIGATTALHTLQAGYRVRLSVRQESQVTKLKSIYAQYADKIEFVITSDITKDDAFAGALDGVSHIIHCASPLAGSPNPEDVIPPAVNGTLSILKEAAKVKSVKKVVITSSVAALMPIGGSLTVPENVVVKEEQPELDLTVAENETYEVDNPIFKSFRVYAGSKLLANKASWDFLANEKPQFDLVTLHPSMVYGTSLVQDSAAASGTNGYIFGSIVSGATDFDALLVSVHVKNVAEAHVRALEDDIKNRSYLLSGKWTSWKELKEWSEKYYPEEAKGFKIVAKTDLKIPKTDASRAEKELGISWTEPEVMIKEVLDQQIAFLKKEGKL